MYIPRYRFAAFDMDGTLLDSMPSWRTAAEVYLARFGQHQLAQELGPMLRGMSCLSGIEFIRDICIQTGIPPMTKEDLYAHMRHHYQTNVQPKPGALEFLQELHRQGVKMCVATASPHALAEPALARHGMLDYFDFVVTTEDYPAGKSKPDMFFGICQRFGSKPEETALFEDALYSIKTGCRLGFYCVAIEDASAAREVSEIRSLVQEYHPDYLEALNA